MSARFFAADRDLSAPPRARRTERLIERVIARLPRAAQKPARWLRRPSARWVRVPAGILLVVGSFLSLLPVFGLWMLPLGLLLLAEDVPPLRRARDRFLIRLARRKPHWFGDKRNEHSSRHPR